MSAQIQDGARHFEQVPLDVDVIVVLRWLTDQNVVLRILKDRSRKRIFEIHEMKLLKHFKKIHLRLVYLTDGFDVLEFSTKLVDKDLVRLDIHVFKYASALVSHLLPFCLVTVL